MIKEENLSIQIDKIREEVDKAIINAYKDLNDEVEEYLKGKDPSDYGINIQYKVKDGKPQMVATIINIKNKEKEKRLNYFL